MCVCENSSSQGWFASLEKGYQPVATAIQHNSYNRNLNNCYWRLKLLAKSLYFYLPQHNQKQAQVAVASCRRCCFAPSLLNCQLHALISAAKLDKFPTKYNKSGHIKVASSSCWLNIKMLPATKHGWGKRTRRRQLKLCRINQWCRRLDAGVASSDCHALISII